MRSIEELFQEWLSEELFQEWLRYGVPTILMLETLIKDVDIDQMRRAFIAGFKCAIDEMKKFTETK